MIVGENSFKATLYTKTTENTKFNSVLYGAEWMMAY